MNLLSEIYGSVPDACRSVRRYRHLNCVIVENAEFAPKHFLIILDCPEYDGDILPGQFVNLKCDSDTTGKLYRPFSVLNFEKSKHRIEIYYHVVGSGSAWLAERKPGIKLKILLPLGNSFSIPAEAKRVVLVAGGVGVAPLLCLYEYLKKNRHDLSVNFLMGARSQEGLCLPLFEKYGIVPVCSTDDGSYGHNGFVTDLLKEHLEIGNVNDSELPESSAEPANPPDFVVTCGPTPMMASVQRICAGRVAGEASLEERMACGIGACMGCVARIRDIDEISHHVTICRHGPVVQLDKVEF